MASSSTLEVIVMTPDGQLITRDRYTDNKSEDYQNFQKAARETERAGAAAAGGAGAAVSYGP